MYLFYLIILLLFVYISPALAIYPRIILSTRTVFAVPFISIFIIFLIKIFLVRIGAFSQTVVIVISIVFIIISLYRVKYNLSLSKFDWPKHHQLIIVYNLLLLISYFFNLGSRSFNTDDEIYSWNMWAVQHFNGEIIDFYYNQSPYPQLFSILIAYCYKILGSIELQLPIKALFVIFPFSLLTVIGIAPKEASYTNAIRYFILAPVLVFCTGINHYFDRGLPDTMMAAALTVSVFLFLEYKNDPKKTALLWISVVCGIVAAYTKQPALIWIIITFPSIVFVSRKKIPSITIAAAVIFFIAGLLWVLGDGSGFYNNHGVISASQHGRNLSPQLIFSINRFFIQKPMIFILLVASFISIYRSKINWDIFFLLLVPSLFAWFLFGSYSIRLGIHVVSLAALLLSATNYSLPFLEDYRIKGRIGSLFKKRKIFFISAIFLIVSIDSAFKINNSIQCIEDGIDLYVGGKNTISKFFGKDSEFVYKTLYKNPDIILWIPSSSIYGIFFGHNNIVRPNYTSNLTGITLNENNIVLPAQNTSMTDHETFFKGIVSEASQKYTIKSVLYEIKKYRPDYLFYANQLGYGSGSDILYELAEKECPYLFEKVAGPQNEFGFIVYRLTKDENLLSQCQP